MIELTDAQILERSRRAQEIFSDPVVKDILIDMEKAAFHDFMASTNDEERRNAQAFARVTKTFSQQLFQVAGSGEHIRLQTQAKPTSTPLFA